MNRDYHTRPLQAGGRTQAGYGHTALAQPPEPSGGLVWIVIAVAALVMAGLWLGGFAEGVV